jgi:mRNA-degrading endonuclease RelE of RelBE toxin-antitoxin system
MRYEILLAPEAVEDLKSLRANERALVKQALETYVRHEPEKVSKSRIKRLKGLSKPQCRLRVGDVRVFYDVSERVVEVLAVLAVLAVVAKGDAEEWLQKAGEG